jgi:hypothetical protein
MTDKIPTPRSFDLDAVLALRCPKCGAPPRVTCDVGQLRTWIPHQERIDLAQTPESP